jgi:hypothetical protein
MKLKLGEGVRVVQEVEEQLVLGFVGVHASLAGPWANGCRGHDRLQHHGYDKLTNPAVPTVPAVPAVRACNVATTEKARPWNLLCTMPGARCVCCPWLVEVVLDSAIR